MNRPLNSGHLFLSRGVRMTEQRIFFGCLSEGNPVELFQAELTAAFRQALRAERRRAQSLGGTRPMAAIALPGSCPAEVDLAEIERLLPARRVFGRKAKAAWTSIYLSAREENYRPIAICASSEGPRFSDPQYAALLCAALRACGREGVRVTRASPPSSE
jgi:hypothetical protein